MSDRAPLLKRVDAPILVIAEGADERRIVYELLRRREPSPAVAAQNYPPLTGAPDVRIVDTGDRDFSRLAGLGPTIPRFDRVQRMILVFDAEEKPLETFTAIRTHLGDSGFPLPDQPWQEATVGDRTCVIAVLPDGTSTGSLEAMLLDGVTLAPNGVSQMRCVDDLIECVGQGSDVLTARRDKRRLYAWLSIQNEPTRFAGEAAASDVLPLGTPQLKRLADLILGEP